MATPTTPSAELTSTKTGFTYRVTVDDGTATIAWSLDGEDFTVESSCPRGVLLACDVPTDDEGFLAAAVAELHGPRLLDSLDGAVLVAWLGGSAEPAGYWPNDDDDAFAVALGQQGIAEGRLVDDQEDEIDEIDAHRSLVQYLADLRVEIVAR